MLTSKALMDRRKQRNRWSLRRKSEGRPRLSVFRSSRQIYAQVIDDERGRTLAAASTLDTDLRAGLKTGATVDAAKQVGELLAKRALEAGVERVVFDRGGYRYDEDGIGMARTPREGRGDREESEFVEKLVSINRVAKVVKGGRRFGFAALVVAGDGRGRVGFGSGKAREVPEAIRKATEQAKRSMVRVPLREGRTLHHDIHGHFGAGKVVLRAAPAGTGVIAGGPMRAIFEALGVQDVVAKSIGTSNPHNMVKATFDALRRVEGPRLVASRRGRRVSDIIGRRETETPAQQEQAANG